MALSGNYHNYPVSSFGLYIEWSAVQSITGNYSDVTQNIYLSYYSVNVGSRSDSTSSINGIPETYTAPAINHNAGKWTTKLLHTQKVRVSHNSSGKARDIPLSASWRFDGTYSGVHIGTITASTKINLNDIDRVAPQVSLTVSGITANSVVINATSDSNTDLWQCSIDNGTKWGELSTAEGYTASKKITGLSPNTTYNIKVRARRKYNQVWGTSSAKSVTTLGNTLLNSVNTLTADVESPIITMNLTVYDSTYKHTLVIKDGSTTVLTITGLTCSVGTNNKTVTLTAAQRTAILEYMACKKSFTATFYLTTYSGSTQIGSTVSKKAAIQTTSDTSAPVFSDFTHKDSNHNGTVDITGNDQIYIKGYSSLQIVIGTVSDKNDATISSYKVTVGSDCKSFTTTTIEYGTIGVPGNVTLKVEVIDSRGYSTAITKTITVIDYEDISITDYIIRRKNEVEPTVQLAFSGDISPITIDSEAQNGVVSAKFRYAPNGGGWSGWSNLAVAETTQNFEYATLALSNSSGVLEFDPNSQYTVDIKIKDRLSSDTMTVILNKGKPLVAYRAKKVGINTSDPQDALDVREGNILMNGYVVQGFVRELDANDDLHSIMQSGIYTQAFSANASIEKHYPVQKAGYLEVFENTEGWILQRYTTLDCSGVYICYFDDSEWSAWKSIGFAFTFGDTFTLNTSSFSASAYITSSAHDLIVQIPISKPICANSVTAEGIIIARGVNGYINGTSWETADISLSGGAGYAVSYKITDTGIVITFTFDNAITNATNNTPVSVTIKNNAVFTFI